jgi:hypothetical protein
MCSLFVLMIPAEENAALSACLEVAPSIAPSLPTTDTRAARLKTFQREQLIVDYLNRGVSVAEIAARVGLSEKRMRAVIREILARRMPHAPEEFVAIQVSRLNEALRIAFSGMTGGNLKAVDRVVRIVRELDRYHGFAAAQRRRPEPPLDAPAEGTMAFGAALVCRPEIALQDFETIGFTPRIALASEAASAAGQAREQDLALAVPYAGFGQGPLARDDRQGVRPTASSPTTVLRTVPLPRADAQGRKGADASPPLRCASETGEGDHPKGGGSGALRAGFEVADRPQNPPQDLEKIESAPRFAPAAENPLRGNTAPEEACAFARRGPEPEEDMSPIDAPLNDRQNPPAWSMLWDATLRVVPQHEARQSPPAAPAGDDRPGIPQQTPEKIESAPGNGWPAEAAPAPDDATPMILTPTGWRRQNIRMTLNGVAAC